MNKHKRKNKNNQQRKVVSNPSVVNSVREIPKNVRVTQQASIWSAPIPPPEAFEKFEGILPGSADRILKMAESQSAHRQQLEIKVINGDNVRANIGAMAAPIVVIAAFICGTVLLLNDKPITGFITMFAPLAIFVGNVIYRKYSKLDKQQPADKNQ